MFLEQVLHFWFQEIEPSQQFKKDLAFDAMLTDRFGKTLELASRGGLAHWRQSLEGRLAEIIVLDQFSRNIYRDQARSFSQDPLALKLALEAIHLGPAHFQLPSAQKTFLYTPLMHSESIPMHEMAMQLYAQPGLENNLKFEILHFAIIKRFGRFPHRNKILGRKSTPEEIEFLKQPNSSF